MSAHITDTVGPLSVAEDRALSMARTGQFDRPTLIVDTARVRTNYRALSAGLGRAVIHYAVKANPAPDVIDALAAEGSRFDAASRGEIALCLSRGVRPERISFGNTVKKASDIEFAHRAGIDLFAVDTDEEMRKIARHAPGARVMLRLIVEANGADWPLTRKFGCDPSRVVPLLNLAHRLGLDPAGLSFHVGSQTRHAAQWAGTLDQAARAWHAAKRAGHDLQLLNIGGGFPAFYGDDVQHPTDYAADVMALVADRFGNVPQLMAEPGRGMVADAGHIAAEVVLVARKSATDLHRWVYLDIGRFSGLAETEDEAIRYQIETSRGGETGPCILAGPSCDSIDVLYEKRPVQLPLSLRAGDRVVIRNTGAYTSSYSSVGFNGFPPLDVLCI